MERSREAIERLVKMMGELRERCPWDREQTFESLRGATIEETYELTEAIDRTDMTAIKEELGDLLLHVVFYCEMASETGAFELDGVINDLCDKLEYRHPHIYGDVEANSTDEVKRNWEALKLKKKKRKSGTLGGVPTALPAMMKAVRIGAKAAATGFDWQRKEDVWEKVREEILEVAAEIESGDQRALEGEFGDLFFALVNAARLYRVDPEAALERTNCKFISRFSSMELAAERKGKSLSEMSLDEMEGLWCEAKAEEHEAENTTNN
ncbi:MAG: nucleoside triphosphate pyrophosphohydrolase [Rikenellaceae bacterium]